MRTLGRGSARSPSARRESSICPATSGRTRPHGALYLSKLAILPDRQGRGLGTWCVAQVEALAAAQGCTVIRFDAIAAHSALLRFYERLGYVERPAPRSLISRVASSSVVVFEKAVLNVEF